MRLEAPVGGGSVGIDPADMEAGIVESDQLAPPPGTAAAAEGPVDEDHVEPQKAAHRPGAQQHEPDPEPATMLDSPIMTAINPARPDGPGLDRAPPRRRPHPAASRGRPGVLEDGTLCLVQPRGQASPQKVPTACPRRRPRPSSPSSRPPIRHRGPRLTYANPFTLLIAVLLSAQATDVSVNRATVSLFEKAPTPEGMLALGEERCATSSRRSGSSGPRPRTSSPSAAS